MAVQSTRIHRKRLAHRFGTNSHLFVGNEMIGHVVVTHRSLIMHGVAVQRIHGHKCLQIRIDIHIVDVVTCQRRHLRRGVVGQVADGHADVHLSVAYIGVYQEVDILFHCGEIATVLQTGGHAFAERGKHRLVVVAAGLYVRLPYPLSREVFDTLVGAAHRPHFVYHKARLWLYLVSDADAVGLGNGGVVRHFRAETALRFEQQLYLTHRAFGLILAVDHRRLALTADGAVYPVAVGGTRKAIDAHCHRRKYKFGVRFLTYVVLNARNGLLHAFGLLLVQIGIIDFHIVFGEQILALGDKLVHAAGTECDHRHDKQRGDEANPFCG